MIYLVDKNGTFTIFADDTTICWHHKNHEILQKIVAQDLIKIREWCSSNLLMFNVSKTHILNFRCSFDIFINDQTIDNAESIRFLGLYIDSELKFETHIIRMLCSQSNFWRTG